MSFRPNKPAYRATPDEIRRVSVITEAELAKTVAYSQFQPSAIPEVKIWLRVDQATDTGTLTIPDAMGGPSATQPTADRKPTLGTTGNGLAKLTCVDDFLTLPVSAGNNDANYFAIGLWIKPANITTSSSIYNMTTASGASVNRLSFRQTTDDLVSFWWDVGGGNNRSARSLSTKAIIATNAWYFACFEINTEGVAETARHNFKLMGTSLPAPNTITYTANPADSVAAPGPALINVVTGNSILFAQTTTPTNPFIGDIGPDIFFYDPRTMTQEKLVQLAQYRVPTG